MEYFIVIIALAAGIIGVAGAVLPALPGPPLSYIGLLLLLLCSNNDLQMFPVIAAGIMAAVITLLDYVAPVWLTKKKGGTQYGIWGATIGMFAGLFMGVIGVIICPFIGAFIGELMAKAPVEKAIKTAFMSFAAFMLTTGLKFIYCIAILVTIAVEGWRILFI